MEKHDQWSISTEPIIIGTTLTLGSESVTVIQPSENTTIFLVVQGTASIDGTLKVDISGRNYSATYTTIAVMKALGISGGFNTISVVNANPEQYVFSLLSRIHILGFSSGIAHRCATYSTWTSQTNSMLNVVLLRNDDACRRNGRGVGKWAAVFGGVVLGLTLLCIGAVMILIQRGILRQTSFLMHATAHEEENRL